MKTPLFAGAELPALAQILFINNTSARAKNCEIKAIIVLPRPQGQMSMREHLFSLWHLGFNQDFHRMVGLGGTLKPLQGDYVQLSGSIKKAKGFKGIIRQRREKGRLLSLGLFLILFCGFVVVPPHIPIFIKEVSIKNHGSDTP